MTSTDFDKAVLQVRQTLKAFGVNDVEGKISWSVVKDLDWWLKYD